MIRPGFTTATQNSGLPLPLPMRVSAGFLVTGLSGKMRMKIFPPRLTLRARETRAASIWRVVAPPRSGALCPEMPEAQVHPRRGLAPLRRALGLAPHAAALGLAILDALGHQHGVLRLRPRALGGQHLALEDPHLHADGPVRRVRLGEAVVDVGADGVQRHSPVAIPFAARD